MGVKPIRPIRIEGNIAYVTLTSGYEAVIDADEITKLAEKAIVYHTKPVPANIEYLGELRREQANHLRSFHAAATPEAWIAQADRIAELEAALKRIDAINDNPSRFSSEINDVLIAARIVSAHDRGE